MLKFKSKIRYFLLILAIFLAGCATSGGSSSSFLGATNTTSPIDEGLIRAPFDTRVAFAPMPFAGDGKVHLGYELQIINMGHLTRKLTKVEVFGDGGTTPLVTYQGDDLKNYVRRPGTPANLPDVRVIGGGMLAVIYCWVKVDDQASVPNGLRHRLYFESLNSAMGEPDDVLDGPPEAVNKTAPPVISPPLRSGKWFAWDGPSNAPLNHHRHALMPFFGKARISQRLAIDWMKMGPDNRLITGDGSKNEDYYGYGEDLLAVADGVVVETKDGLPDNVPLSPVRAVPMTMENITGNYVLLDLGNGYYVAYCHLIAGTLQVNVGDHVIRGQVLGLLGNSGNSDAPHLHFHLCNAPSGLASEGVPYIHESFTLHGHWEPDMNVFPDETWVPGPGDVDVLRTNEMPMDRAIVTFP